jgi:hypothetical protein
VCPKNAIGYNIKKDFDGSIQGENDKEKVS